jgi:hypothetical protein
MQTAAPSCRQQDPRGLCRCSSSTAVPNRGQIFRNFFRFLHLPITRKAEGQRTWQVEAGREMTISSPGQWAPLSRLLDVVHEEAGTTFDA